VEDERSGMASEVLLTPSGDEADDDRWDGAVVKALDVVHIERNSALRRIVETVI